MTGLPRGAAKAEARQAIWFAAGAAVTLAVVLVIPSLRSGGSTSCVVGKYPVLAAGAQPQGGSSEVDGLGSFEEWDQAAEEEATGSFDRGAQNEALQGEFERIYRSKLWGSAGNGSGDGSSIGATEGIRNILIQAISALNVTSMIDCPCGGMAWMPVVLKKVERQRPGFRYLGLDIAHSVAERNKVAFANHTNWRFGTFDLTAQRLPRGYDLIHTRDALQHLSCPHVVAALRNVAHSGARYVLVGSYDGSDNSVIRDGDYFSINLREPPYSLSSPLGVFPEVTAPGPPKFMLLYSVAALRKEDFGAMELRCTLESPSSSSSSVEAPMKR